MRGGRDGGGNATLFLLLPVQLIHNGIKISFTGDWGMAQSVKSGLPSMRASVGSQNPCQSWE